MSAAAPYLRLALLLAVFVALTALGIYWVAPDAEVLVVGWRHFAGLGVGTHLALAGFALGLVGAEMVRLVVMGRALGVRVGFRAALNATIANNFFSWLTPGSALGEPAATYMLGRAGVPWDAAALIAFGKLALSFAFIFGLASILVIAGMGPALAPWLIVPLAVAAGIMAFIWFLLLAGSFFPDKSAAAITRLERWALDTRVLGAGRRARAIRAVAHHGRQGTERLSRFRRCGAGHWVAIVASHLLYYAAFLGVFTTLAAAFESTDIGQAAATALVYMAFLYAAPTPGGSGLGEASADLFFADVLPGGGALVVVVLFRAATFYFHVVLGLLYLPVVGGMGAILLRGRGRSGDEPGDELVDDDEIHAHGQ